MASIVISIFKAAATNEYYLHDLSIQILLGYELKSPTFEVPFPDYTIKLSDIL